MEPSCASYQGGASEEFYIPMVGEHLVNELTLRKFLGEVEKILNDKPITPLSTDPQDLEALTPNQILLLRRDPCSSPELFEEWNRFKDRLKQVHLLTNEYWQRWTKKVSVDAPITPEVVRNIVQLPGWRFTVVSSQKLVRETVAKGLGRANISRSRRHSTPRFRRTRRRSVPQRCPKSLPIERAVTRCPRGH